MKTSPDLYRGNCVFLFRSYFLFYAKNRETFKKNCEHDFQRHINQELGPKSKGGKGVSDLLFRSSKAPNSGQWR